VALTDRAILQIKEMIRSGELRPGDRLPPEKELSASLGLSRSSLREAVKALEILRVLDVRRGDGTYVTSLEPRLLLESMSFAVEVHQDTSILDVFAVRRILEPAAAVMATARATPEDVQRLRDLLVEVDAGTSIDDLVAHDMAFHRSLSSLSGNAYLVGLIDTLSSRTLRARVWRGLTEEGAVERTLAEHQAIVDAVEAGDAALVRARTLVHVSGVEDWLRRALA
jgi:GntR family transcriptional regulator, transcriptional repressor for pyruvate dehydrogenase complex